MLCGGVTALVNAGFETLVERRLPARGRLLRVPARAEAHRRPDVRGRRVSWMRYSVSDTAEYGDLTRGPRVIGRATRHAMAKLLADIQSGEFAREWIAEDDAGRPNFERLRAGGQDRADRAGRQAAAEDDELAQLGREGDGRVMGGDVSRRGIADGTSARPTSSRTCRRRRRAGGHRRRAALRRRGRRPARVRRRLAVLRARRRALPAHRRGAAGRGAGRTAPVRRDPARRGRHARTCRRACWSAACCCGCGSSWTCT